MKKRLKEAQRNHKRKLEDVLGDIFPLHKARLKFLSMMLIALVQEKTVNLVKLSLAFQGLAEPESSYRRIKRFFSEVKLNETSIASLILNLLPEPPYTVCVDRTNWKFGKANINILVIAIAHRGIAFPIVWSFLDKQGNSSSDDRIDLLQSFLEVVKAQEIEFFLADREFIGETWFNYLDKRKIAFAIRVRNNSLCDNWCSVYALFKHLPIGELRLLKNSYRMYGCNLRLSGMRLSHNDYAIIVTNRNPASAFIAYKRRWEIEMLFAALKTTGFDIEATHMTQASKLNTLFALLAIAFTWAHHVGEWLHDSKTKVIKLKAHLRREKSFFRHGLDHLSHLLKNLDFRHRDLSFCIQLLSRT